MCPRKQIADLGIIFFRRSYLIHWYQLLHPHVVGSILFRFFLGHPVYIGFTPDQRMNSVFLQAFICKGFCALSTYPKKRSIHFPALPHTCIKHGCERTNRIANNIQTGTSLVYVFIKGTDVFSLFLSDRRHSQSSHLIAVSRPDMSFSCDCHWLNGHRWAVMLTCMPEPDMCNRSSLMNYMYILWAINRSNGCMQRLCESVLI